MTTLKIHVFIQQIYLTSETIPKLTFHQFTLHQISSLKYEFPKYQRFGKPLLQASYQKGRIKPLKYPT